jgi:hypothetical protein
VRRLEAKVLTAKVTAILSDVGNRERTSADPSYRLFILRERRWTLADVRNAVFKTVCGALLRRPGWVRFPSIPAKFGIDDSQVDSHSSAYQRTPGRRSGRSSAQFDLIG